MGTPASHCAGCGALFATLHATCPYCQAACKGNLWQEILALALGHGIWVHRVKPSASLADRGGIAALLARDESQWWSTETPDLELEETAP